MMLPLILCSKLVPDFVQGTAKNQNPSMFPHRMLWNCTLRVVQQVRGAAHLQSGAPHLVDDGQNPKGQADTLLAAVLHQLKLAIRRHKADHLLGVEAPQVDTLVEGHILHADTDRRSQPSSDNDHCSSRSRLLAYNDRKNV